MVGLSAKLLRINGELLSFAEIARRAGVSPQAIRTRFRKGRRGEDLLAGPMTTAEKQSLAAASREKIKSTRGR